MTVREHWEAEKARHNGSIMLSDPVAAIEAAVKEEREACAKIADALNLPVSDAAADYWNAWGRTEAAEEIAGAIRKRA